jgi:hypothetical protein
MSPISVQGVVYITSIETHYDQISAAIQNIPKRFTRIYIGGDANGRVGGVEKEVWDTEIGMHIRDSEYNSNGISLLQFCKEERLCVANSMFSQDKYGSGTFHMPGTDEYTKALDYILVPVIGMHEIKECRVLGEVHFPLSDHRMVFAEVHITNKRKVKASTQIKTQKTPDYRALKVVEIRDEFNVKYRELLTVKEITRRCEIEMEAMRNGASGDSNVVESLYLDYMECLQQASVISLPKKPKSEVAKNNWFTKYKSTLIPFIERKSKAYGRWKNAIRLQETGIVERYEYLKTIDKVKQLCQNIGMNIMPQLLKNWRIYAIRMICLGTIKKYLQS